jgi:hypothetical protein
MCCFLVEVAAVEQSQGGGLSGGGGGAGGAQLYTVFLSAGTISVDVGAGGATYTSGLGSAVGTAVGSPASGGGGFGRWSCCWR